MRPASQFVQDTGDAAALAHSAPSPALAHLISNLRRVVDAHLGVAGTATRVAQVVEPLLREPDLLLPEQREPDPEYYRQHVLHAEADGSFSIVSLVWLPGQATPIHDHVSWCVVGVYRGCEHE